MDIRTSQTDPIKIESVRATPSTGLIGMTFCPGKTDLDAMSGAWKRDLDLDLDAAIAWGALAVISLIEDHEFELLKVPGLGSAVESKGMKWFHLPIRDVKPPDSRFTDQWRVDGPQIHAILNGGGSVVLHCRGGLGRTGTVAAQLLVEMGMDPYDAISEVRAARPGAIETTEQKNYVLGLSKRGNPQINSERDPQFPLSYEEIRKIPVATVEDRFRGCLLGGAVGDALGAPVEFSPTENIFSRHPKGVRDFLPEYGRIGAITDDTQMTLFTAEALLRAQHAASDRGPVSIREVMDYAYIRWLSTQGESVSPGRRNIGSNDDFLRDIVMSGFLLDQSELHARRAPGETCLKGIRTGVAVSESKGCGGVMRVAPIGLAGFAASWDDEQIWQEGSDAAGLTHGHPDGQRPAGYLAVLIKALAEGQGLQDASLRARTGGGDTDRLIREAINLAQLGPFDLSLLEQLGKGWVGEEAIAISLYCALTAGNFEDGVINAVSHGGDSDSTGSITGQILGTIHGVAGIPVRWLSALELRGTIEIVACDMAAMRGDGSENDQSRKQAIWDARYPPN